MSHWTVRDLEIVESLALRVRVLTVRQMSAIWWRDPDRSRRVIRRCLRRLVLAGLLVRTTINALPVVPTTEPLLQWQPGQPVPDFGHLTRSVSRRSGTASIPTVVYTASRIAGNLFGGIADESPSVDGINHELRLAEVFASRCRETQKSWYRNLLPADDRPYLQNGVCVIDSTGALTKIVRSSQRYTVRQTERFHERCTEHALSYELW